MSDLLILTGVDVELSAESSSNTVCEELLVAFERENALMSLLFNEASLRFRGSCGLESFFERLLCKLNPILTGVLALASTFTAFTSLLLTFTVVPKSLPEVAAPKSFCKSIIN